MPHTLKKTTLGACAAMLIILWETLSSAQSTSIFPDLSLDHLYYNEIEDLLEKGIIHGNLDGTIDADGPINRAALAKILVEATTDDATIQSAQLEPDIYSDVIPGAWYLSYLKVAHDKNIITGDDSTASGPTTVRPDDDANGAEVAKMVSIAFDLKVPQAQPSQEWYEPYLATFQELEALPYEAPGHKVTRGEMMFMVSRTMNMTETSITSDLPSDLQALEDANKARLIKGCFSGKDCIPSIDTPKFVSADEADAEFLEDDDWVIGLERNGEIRAYPLKILTHHEIVNDTVGEEPIAISFCPLCFTGNAFKREVGGEPTTFGVSGYLINSNLVMYDRATDSLWEQLTGEALTGPHIGSKLKKITVSTMPWPDWKTQHPTTIVLSTDTGFSRNYDVSPYDSYEDSAEVYFELEHEDDRLFSKELTFGVLVQGQAKAYPLATLDQEFPSGGTFQDTVGDHNVEVTWENGTFTIIELETSTEVIPEIGFWFSWAAFFPDTEIYGLE